MVERLFDRGVKKAQATLWVLTSILVRISEIRRSVAAFRFIQRFPKSIKLYNASPIIIHFSLHPAEKVTMGLQFFSSLQRIVESAGIR